MKIADVVLTSIYGEEINDEKPFVVELDNKKNRRIVKGRMKENELGGAAEIIISKKNGKIVYVNHGK